MTKQGLREAAACQRIKARHYGASGDVDCRLPDGSAVEVKDWRRPLRPSDVRRVARDRKYRGRPFLLCVIGPGGYTPEAAKAARDLGGRVSTCARRPRTPLWGSFGSKRGG